MSTRELPIVILPDEGKHLFNDETKGYLLSTGHALPALWPGRDCGTCTLCCTVMAVHEEGVDTKYGRGLRTPAQAQRLRDLRDAPDSVQKVVVSLASRRAA